MDLLLQFMTFMLFVELSFAFVTSYLKTFFLFVYIYLPTDIDCSFILEFLQRLNNIEKMVNFVE